jgi:hypothetical protein
MKQSKNIHQHETLFNEGNLMVSLVAVQFFELSNCGDEWPFVDWERIIGQIRNTEKDVLYFIQNPSRCKQGEHFATFETVAVACW